jgi:hypothetical protein
MHRAPNVTRQRLADPRPAEPLGGPGGQSIVRRARLAALCRQQ